MSFINTHKILHRLLLLTSTILIVSGCISTTQVDANKQQPIENAQQTINWPGTYQGILPCPSGCAGIATMVILYPDNHFTLRTRKIDVDIKDRTEKGHFTWLAGNNDINLTGDKPLSTPVSHIKIGRDSIAIVFPATKKTGKNNVIVLNKTGGLPTPPPTI